MTLELWYLALQTIFSGFTCLGVGFAAAQFYTSRKDREEELRQEALRSAWHLIQETHEKIEICKRWIDELDSRRRRILDVAINVKSFERYEQVAEAMQGAAAELSECAGPIDERIQELQVYQEGLRHGIDFLRVNVSTLNAEGIHVARIEMTKLPPDVDNLLADIDLAIELAETHIEWAEGEVNTQGFQ